VDDADPNRIHSLDDLKRELDLLRRAEGRRLGKHQLSLQDLVKRVKEERAGQEVPRSTLDNYVNGRTLAPHEIYEACLRALGVDAAALAPWADAWDRLDDARRSPSAGDDPEPTTTLATRPTSAPMSRRKHVAVGALAGAAMLAAVAIVVAITRFPGDESTTAFECPGPQKICLWSGEVDDHANRYGPIPPSWSLTDSRIPFAGALAGFNNSNQNQRLWSDIDLQGQCTGLVRVWYAGERFTNHPWAVRCVNHT